MGCRKLTYWNEVEIPPRRDYEKPATPLKVLPDNEEITVIVVYSIQYNNEKVVPIRTPEWSQGWLLPDPAEQFLNPYLAMGNNPVVYVDPDGEFVFLPILIGAALGGAINLGIQAHQGNIDNWGDGLAAFGIGAAAGALGAATGGAAFVAAGGGTAGAGGFGAGFISGAIGAAYSAPIQSIGNNIAFNTPVMTSSEFGRAILGGGIIGGAIHGRLALAQGKTFWAGKNPSMDYRLDGYELIQQNSPMSCKEATCASIEKLNGGSRTQEYFQEQGAIYLRDNPTATLEDYFEHFGFDVQDPSTWKPQQIGRGMELGNPTVISEIISSDRQHILTITRIRQWSPNGKIKVWFADPSRGSWRGSWNSTVGNRNFNDGSYLFWLNK